MPRAVSCLATDDYFPFAFLLRLNSGFGIEVSEITGKHEDPADEDRTRKNGVYLQSRAHATRTRRGISWLPLIGFLRRRMLIPLRGTLRSYNKHVVEDNALQRGDGNVARDVQNISPGARPSLVINTLPENTLLLHLRWIK